VKTCYVSMPFGNKEVSSGASIDFDRLYVEVIKPAVQGAGLACQRADELSSDTLIQRTILSAVLGSDVMIADLSTGNANVLYELGIRHTAQRSVTILLSANTEPIPFDINYSKVILYTLDANGAIPLDAASALRNTIVSALRVGLEHAAVDSPLYEFFPELRMELPQSLTSPRAKRRLSTPTRKSRSSIDGAPTPEGPRAAVVRAEKEVLSEADVEPVTLVNLLKAYRDISAWNDVIRLADELPPQVRNSPEVLQLLALALNRRAETGDQERAISIMQKLVDETGGDAETYGILGRIYKDRYAASGSEEDLEMALHCYRAGFETQPSDFYPGVNVVTLLLKRKDEASREELETILPRVRKAVEDKMRGGVVGYWELATALHLACVAKEWSEAEMLVHRAMEQSPARWMLETTLRDLASLQDNMEEPDRSRLLEVIGLFREGMGVQDA
jgi:tetratricopeptide (TPR) repeat protein